MKTPVLSIASLIAASGLLLAQAPKPNAVAAPVPSEEREEVGISANDGISVSGKDILITRNGVSERLTKEMHLTNGTRVSPDGSITLSDGTQLSLKANQVLTLGGVVRDVPDRAASAPRSIALETVAPAPTISLPEDSAPATTVGASTIQDGVAFYNGLPYLIRNGRASIIDRKLVPEGQILTLDGHFIPIPFTFKDLPPVNIQRGTEQQTRTGEPGDQKR